MVSDNDTEAGLDNLIRRYQLMGQEIIVNESNTERRIIVPLLNRKEEVVND